MSEFSSSNLIAIGDTSCSKKPYSFPEVHCAGYAVDTILARAQCESALAARRIKHLIDEFGGSLAFSPAKECEKVQINLSLVSKQFKKIYQVTIRAYARQLRMNKAEQLLREATGLNVDEAARALGYSFTSAFSRCFEKTHGKRPKRYQMQFGRSAEGVGPTNGDPGSFADQMPMTVDASQLQTSNETN